jgi:mRNA-degrading endonuclease YafQ of YafQ-DinJ toxin-antitoxin module
MTSHAAAAKAYIMVPVFQVLSDLSQRYLEYIPYHKDHFSKEIWELHHDPVTAQDIPIVCTNCIKAQTLKTNYVGVHAEAIALQHWLREEKHAKQNVTEDELSLFHVIFEGMCDDQ